jgi:hypothetical protein
MKCLLLVCLLLPDLIRPYHFLPFLVHQYSPSENRHRENRLQGLLPSRWNNGYGLSSRGHALQFKDHQLIALTIYAKLMRACLDCGHHQGFLHISTLAPARQLLLILQLVFGTLEHLKMYTTNHRGIKWPNHSRLL